MSKAICKNCKHIKDPSFFSSTLWRCLQVPKKDHTNYQTGVVTAVYEYCEAVNPKGKCKMFEVKEVEHAEGI